MPQTTQGESRAKTTGKQRATRIPMDYFKKPTGLEWWKLALGLLALILTGVWLLYGFLADSGAAPAPQWMKTRYSHGPVAKVHQPIEAECEKCHFNFAGLRDVGPNLKTCQACHMDDKNQVHSPLQLASSTPNCGACHKDHRGVDVDLTAMDDRFCTGCHLNLGDHMKGKSDHKNNISAFHRDHPNFRLFGKEEDSRDPGTLKFNHKYHMTEGIVLVEGGKPMTLADLPAGEARERYRSLQPKGMTSDTSPIQMSCASCHEVITEPLETTAERARAANGDVQPLLTPGSYMKPVTYDRHCAACHSLRVDPILEKPVPHGKQPEELEQILRKEYQRIAQTDRSRLESQAPRIRPLPGMKGTTTDKVDLKTLINQKVQSALTTLMESRRGCAECHFDADGSELSLDSKKVQAMANGKLIPDYWMPHAQFSHAAHDSAEVKMACVECHKGARASSEQFTAEVQQDSQKRRNGAEEAMMPDISNCLHCHSSEGAAVSLPWKGAGVDRVPADSRCVECHLYHRGQAPGGPAVWHPHPSGKRLRQAKINEKKLNELMKILMK